MATVFLTGSNRGIGLEFVRQLVARGDHVFATCRRPNQADALQALRDAHPDHVTIASLDVAAPDSIRAAVHAADEAMGQIEVLINNAGVNGGGSGDRWGTLDRETLMRVFAVNAAGPALLAQQATPLLSAAAEGGSTPKVVNITSQLGSIARVGGSGSWYSYRASKAALNMLTRQMAFDLRPKGIVAVAMHPGWVQTDMGGANASITPETSVSGMLQNIDRFTMEAAGSFQAWDGTTLPW